MLGYTENDINDMLDTIDNAIELLPLDNTAANRVVEQLENVISFLQGIIIEGHVGD